MRRTAGSLRLFDHSALWIDGFKKLTLSHVDFANHPSSAATIPDILLDCLGPPSSSRADTPDIAQANSLAKSPQCIAQYVFQIGHHGIHHLLGRAQEITPCNNEAHLGLAIVLVLVRSGTSIARAQWDVAQQHIEPRNERHGEIGGIDDVVDVVILVRRLLNCLSQRLDTWMVHGDLCGVAFCRMV